jgi:hypothetical protein
MLRDGPTPETAAGRPDDDEDAVHVESGGH